jgi:hypothetical protein
MTNGKLAYAVKREGAHKRCGGNKLCMFHNISGQGDILCGLTALYSYWDLQYQKCNIIFIDIIFY